MTKSKSEPPRGVLNQKRGDLIGLSRYHPNRNLAYFIEHYWIVTWDLQGKEPYEQDVLSHPSVHLVFEKGNTRIWGVVTGKFTRKLEGRGKVVGIKFRPGGFYPFYQKSVAEFTDSNLSFYEVFDEELESLEQQILHHGENGKMVEQVEKFLMSYLPEIDPNIEKVGSIVETIREDRSIIKVNDITEQFNLSKRALQRLFRQYIGVNPKWVIQRYRLHEAAEQMASSDNQNLSQMALDLGYFDQSHFIRDFKTVVGKSPAEYMEALKNN